MLLMLHLVVVHMPNGFGDVMVIIADRELRIASTSSSEARAVLSRTACSLSSNVSQLCLFGGGACVVLDCLSSAVHCGEEV